MAFQFATCDRQRALSFLQQLYPGATVEDTQESAASVLDYVERDIIRIPDPSMHGLRVAILPTTNWTPEMESEVVAALEKFHDSASS